MKRAQTSVEYVILLAIVIVIAILVSNNLDMFKGLGVKTGERKALAYMSAQDVAVLNYVITNESATLQIQNPKPNLIRVSDITIAGTSCTTSDIPKIFSIGEKRTVTCSNINATGRYEYNITITWKDIKNDATYIINDSKMLLVGKNYQTALSSSGEGGGEEGPPTIPEGLTYDLFLIEDYNSGSVIVNQSTNSSSVGVSLTFIGTTAAGYDATSGSFLGKVFYNSSDVYWNSTIDSATSDYLDTLSYIDTTDLISYHRLNYNGLDAYGSDDGALFGSPTNISGMVGGALRFAGSSDCYEINDYTLTDNGHTWAIWVKIDSTEGTGNCVFGTCRGNNENSGYGIKYYDGGSTEYIRGALHNSDMSTNLVVEWDPYFDKWTHVVFTTTGLSGTETGKLYVNGIEADSHTGSATLTNVYQRFIGCGDDGSAGRAGYLEGDLDEAIEWNRTLSAAEVLEIFENQKEYYGIGYGTTEGMG